MTHKRHSAAFKAQVALEALKKKETLAELAKKFALHPQQVFKPSYYSDRAVFYFCTEHCRTNIGENG